MSSASAEIAKLALNCFVTTKISFANMIGTHIYIVIHIHTIHDTYMYMYYSGK